jgi:hypothetical protein
MTFRLAALKFRPGMVRDDTEYSAEGTWIDGDKVRSYRGFMEKIGGWQRMQSAAVSGKCRGLFSWADNDGLRWLMAGTHTDLYVTDTDSLYTITGLGRVRSICYGNATWLAVGEGGEAAYSLDGITWTLLDDVGMGTSVIRDCAYGNGTWVIVGDHAQIAKSTNLSTWEVGTINAFIGTRFRATIYAVEYDGIGTWAVAGQGGVLVVSNDLETFTTAAPDFGVSDIYDIGHTRQAFGSNYCWMACGADGKVRSLAGAASAGVLATATWGVVSTGVTDAAFLTLEYNHNVTTWVAAGERARLMTAGTAAPTALTMQKSSFLAGRYITIYSAGNLSAVNFTITGRTTRDDAATETLTGPNNATVTSIKRWREITAVAASTAVPTNVEVGFAGDRDAVCAAQTLGAAGNLVIDGADASAGEVDWGPIDETIRSVASYTAGGTTYWAAVGDEGKIATSDGASPATWTQVATTTVSQALYTVMNNLTGTWVAGGENGALISTTGTAATSGWAGLTSPFGDEDSPENEHGSGGPGWGASGWSDPRASGGGWSDPAAATEIYPRTWSLAKWGQYGIANPRFGRIWEWRLDKDVSAQVVSGSPARVNGVLVTSENIMVALGSDQEGSFDPMLVSWSDVADNTTWIPQSANYSGNQRLAEGGFIVAGKPAKGESLIWTDTSLYSMVFRPGDADIPFEFTLIGNNCGLIGPNAAVVIDGSTFWWGRNGGAYLYEGQLPLQLAPNPVRRYVGSLLESVDWEEIYAGSNVEYNEIIWFFPRTGEEDCSDYVVFNYVDKIWFTGRMERTAWLDRGIIENPVAVDWEGVLWYHEIGHNAGTAPMTAFVRSAPMDIDDGDRVVRLDSIVTDFVLSGECEIIPSYRRYPQDVLRTKSPLTVTPTTRKVDTRLEGRQVAIEVRSDGLDDFWRLGQLRINVRTAGRR